MCACAATRVAEGGAGWLSRWWRRRVRFRGPPVKQGRSHLRTKWLQREQRCWRPCLLGDNGPKSKTDSLLRGNAKPASELVKKLLCISEGAACLMADTRRGNLAALWPCKRKKKPRKKTTSCTFNLWCRAQFYSKQLWLIKA